MQVEHLPLHEPYGAPSNNIYLDGPGYTGHVVDGLTGLSYMQARYYDPLAGRFLGVDPVGVGNGENFNRYWYGNDNPFTFMDPDGRQSAGTQEHPLDMLRRAGESVLYNARRMSPTISIGYDFDPNGSGERDQTLDDHGVNFVGVEVEGTIQPVWHPDGLDFAVSLNGKGGGSTGKSSPNKFGQPIPRIRGFVGVGMMNQSTSDAAGKTLEFTVHGGSVGATLKVSDNTGAPIGFEINGGYGIQVSGAEVQTIVDWSIQRDVLGLME